MSYLLPTWALKITLPTFGLKAPVIIRVKVKKCEQMLVFIALHYRGYTSLEVKGWCLSVESNHAQQVMNGHARLWERFDSRFDSSYLSVYDFSWLRLYMCMLLDITFWHTNHYTPSSTNIQHTFIANFIPMCSFSWYMETFSIVWSKHILRHAWQACRLCWFLHIHSDTSPSLSPSMLTS